DQNGGEQQIRERRGKKQRKAVDQIAHTGNLHQNAQDPRQIAGPDDQVPEEKTHTAKIDETDAKAVSMDLDREVSQSVELARLECLQVIRLAQEKQRDQKSQLVGAQNGSLHQIEKRRQQSEILVDRPEQNVKDHRQADITHVHDQIAGNAEAPQRLGGH